MKQYLCNNVSTELNVPDVRFYGVISGYAHAKWFS